MAKKVVKKKKHHSVKFDCIISDPQEEAAILPALYYQTCVNYHSCLLGITEIQSEMSIMKNKLGVKYRKSAKGRTTEGSISEMVENDSEFLKLKKKLTKLKQDSQSYTPVLETIKFRGKMVQTLLLPKEL